MKLEGRKVMVNKSTKDLFEMLKKPEDYKHLMPESLVSFETTETRKPSPDPEQWR